MELFQSETGSVSCGWLGTDVYFARFTGELSAALGAQHLSHLQAAVEGSSGLRYFSDCSQLTSYDLLARSAFVRLVLSQRRRFRDLVILSWPTAGASPVSPNAGSVAGSHPAQAFAAAVGEPLVVVTNRSDFEGMLLAAAPGATRAALAPPAGQAPRHAH